MSVSTRTKGLSRTAARRRVPLKAIAALGCATAGFLPLTRSAVAADVWSAPGGTGNWQTPGNWNLGVPTSTTAVSFTISSTGPAGTLTFNAGGIVNTASTHVWNVTSPLRLEGGTLNTGSLVTPDRNLITFDKGALKLAGGVSSNAGNWTVGNMAR